MTILRSRSHPWAWGIAVLSACALAICALGVHALRPDAHPAVSVASGRPAHVKPLATVPHAHAATTQPDSGAPGRPAMLQSLIDLVALMSLLSLFFIATRPRRARVKRRPSPQEEGLRALLDASPDAMWVKDRGGVYRACNDRVFDLLGVERLRLRGRTDELLVGSELARVLRREDAATMESGQPQTYTLPVLRDGRVPRQLEVTKVPWRDPSGKVAGTLGVARDVTAQRRLEAAHRAWGNAFAHAALGIAVFDVATRRISAANAAFAERRGYSPEEMTGLPVDTLYPADLVEQRRAARRQIDACDHSVVETEQVTRSGERFPVRLDCSVVHTQDHCAETVIVYALDLTARKRADAELRLAATAFDTQDAMLVTDPSGTIIRVNPAFTKLTGFAPAEVLGQRVSGLMPPDVGGAEDTPVLDSVRPTGSWCGEQILRTSRGVTKPVRSTISVVSDGSGRVTHHVIALFDLTREREARADIERLTFFDPLTALPNARYLNTRLRQLLLQGPASAQTALILLDFDALKQFNDRHGPTVGDQLLVALAQRLRERVDHASVVSRIRHGTFAVLKPGLLASTGFEVADTCATTHVEDLRRALSEPLQLAPNVIAHMTLSVGWTALGCGQRTPADVLGEAELAMQCAKASGGNRAHRFVPEMRVARARNDALARELSDAIGTRELELHYQAQANRYGEIVGAEALLRWTRRSGEHVPPETFIRVAETNGLIVPLGRWALERALRQLAAWADDPSTAALSLAVNVSARQFALPTFVDDVTHLISATGANAHRLKLEITESTVLDNLGECAHKLAQLRAAGMHISIDDFGTGYSSLAYLARLPLDQLKVDRSFVKRLPEDRSDAAVTQTIINLGHRLGLEVIAEGVETEAQQLFLRAHDCDVFQGYLISRPVPLSAFESLLAGARDLRVVEG